MDLQLYLKRDSSTTSFCEFCKIFNSIFLQNTTVRLLLIIVISKLVKGELANEIVNYDTENKTHQFEPAV